MGNATADEYDTLKGKCSPPSLVRFSQTLAELRCSVIDMRIKVIECSREVDLVLRKLEECRSNGLGGQAERIAALGAAISRKRSENASLQREMQIEEQPRFVDRCEIQRLDRTLAERRAALKQATARYEGVRAGGTRSKTEHLDAGRDSQKVVVAVGLFRRKVCENEMRALFSKFGAIRSISVHAKANSDCLCFAKIAFYEYHVAHVALRTMNGHVFEGYPINVKWARDQAVKDVSRTDLFFQPPKPAAEHPEVKLRIKIRKEAEKLTDDSDTDIYDIAVSGDSTSSESGSA
jgi:hypothetical protein